MKITFTNKEMVSVETMARSMFNLVNASNPNYKFTDDQINQMLKDMFPVDKKNDKPFGDKLVEDTLELNSLDAYSKMFTTEMTEEGYSITYNEEFVCDAMDMYVKIATVAVGPISKLVTKVIVIIEENPIVNKIFEKVSKWFMDTEEVKELKESFENIQEELEEMMEKYV
jgi:hypothetical protein